MDLVFFPLVNPYPSQNRCSCNWKQLLTYHHHVFMCHPRWSGTWRAPTTAGPTRRRPPPPAALDPGRAACAGIPPHTHFYASGFSVIAVAWHITDPEMRWNRGGMNKNLASPFDVLPAIFGDVIFSQQPSPDALCRRPSSQQRLLAWLRLHLPGCQHTLQAPLTHALWHHQPGSSLSMKIWVPSLIRTQRTPLSRQNLIADSFNP